MGKIITFFSRKKPLVYEAFNDSSLNSNWIALIGTWGTTGGRIYSVSDTSMDLVSINARSNNYRLSCVTNGQISDINNQRFINIIFRLNDATNYLMTRITGGNLHLYKCVAGTLSLLTQVATGNTNGVDYLFTVRCQDNDIRISVNGVQLLQYTLSGGDTVFAAYTKAGLRLTKTGTPTLPANAENFRIDPV